MQKCVVAGARLVDAGQQPVDDAPPIARSNHQLRHAGACDQRATVLHGRSLEGPHRGRPNRNDTPTGAATAFDRLHGGLRDVESLREGKCGVEYGVAGRGQPGGVCDACNGHSTFSQTEEHLPA